MTLMSYDEYNDFLAKMNADSHLRALYDENCGTLYRRFRFIHFNNRPRDDLGNPVAFTEHQIANYIAADMESGDRKLRQYLEKIKSPDSLWKYAKMFAKAVVDGHCPCKCEES